MITVCRVNASAGANETAPGHGVGGSTMLQNGTQPGILKITWPMSASVAREMPHAFGLKM